MAIRISNRARLTLMYFVAAALMQVSDPLLEAVADFGYAILAYVVFEMFYIFAKSVVTKVSLFKD